MRTAVAEDEDEDYDKKKAPGKSKKDEVLKPKHAWIKIN